MFAPSMLTESLPINARGPMKQTSHLRPIHLIHVNIGLTSTPSDQITGIETVAN